MDPNVWGPCIWSTLFSISFRCNDHHLKQVKELLKNLGSLIPCPTCKEHYSRNKVYADKKYPIEKSLTNLQHWLWYVKSLVNKNLKIKDTEFKYIKIRYELNHHTINELELADVLLLISMTLDDKKMEIFEEFTNSLATILLSFMKSNLPVLLLCFDKTPVNMLKISNSIRQNNNLKERTLSFYKPFLK